MTFHLESITAGGDCAVLSITGEIDVYTAPELRERIIELVAAGVRHLVADLRDVDFVDSTGLGVLVGGLKRLRTQDGSLQLVTTAGRVVQIFEVTGLTHAFPLYPSIPAAIAADETWQAALAREGTTTDEWSQKHGLA